MSIKLIFKDRKFASLFWTQFLGALNDNFLKNSLITFITYKSISIMGLEANALVTLASGIFILPFFMFSPLAGQIADKFQKSKLIRITKLFELGIMIIAVVGFYYEYYWLLLCVLFFIGTQAAFFGPLKFSIIPQIVELEQLSEVNAYVEMGTFLAILIGTISGGLVMMNTHFVPLITTILLSVSVLGVWASFKLPSVAAGNAHLIINLNPIPGFCEMWKLMQEKKAIFYSILGISWFWFFGAGILSMLPGYCKNFLGANEEVVAGFLAMFTIGIGVGSIICSKISFGRVEIGVVPIGSLGMTIFLFDLSQIIPHWTVSNNLIGISQFISNWQGIRLLIDFFFTAVFGGLFIVPLYALMQERSHSDSRSRVVAANNVMNALFMTVASILILIFYTLHLNFLQIFLIMCFLNMVVAIYIYSLVPEFAIRFISWILVNIMYRLRIQGDENIPKEGAVILACNHVSFIDWLIIMGAIKRPTRFVVYYKFLEIPVLRYLMRKANVIPIAGRDENPEVFKEAYEKIAAAIVAGQIICIFPEGKITENGELNEFKPGILKVIEQNQTPVIPMAIHNLWGSMFSRKAGRTIFRAPRKFWKTITLRIDKEILP